MADGSDDCGEPAGPPPADLGWWRIHARLAEAAVLLIGAKLLVKFVPFGRWRDALGRLSPAGEPKGLARDGQCPDARDRYLSRVVDRAAFRLPGEFRCLPRAIALQWMLARRGRRPALVIGVLPGPRRGHLDDLHAWVELGGVVLIGGAVESYVKLARLER